MRPAQRLLVHLAVLVAACLAAVYVWTRDDDDAPKVASDVTVWGGKPADVQKIVFESKTRRIELDSRVDEVGRWFEGTVTRQAPVRAPVGDAGVEPEPKPPTVIQVVSVKVAERIAEAVAPLRAVREIGEVSGDGAADFGLTEPEGTLSLTLAGQERKLVVGGSAPGGQDRYVRHGDTERVYAVRGDFLRDLLSGESVLIERDVHGFDQDEILKARIVFREKEREVVRSGSGPTVFWASPSEPDKTDEVMGTWMTKVARLRPTEFVVSLPESSNLFLRIEYMGKKGNLGFLELHRLAGEEEKKAEWFMRTEHTRKYAKVFGATAEQVEQDLSSILP